MITQKRPTCNISRFKKKGSIVPLHKKGDKPVCENFRGIALLNAAYKVYARVLYSRLQPHAEIVLGEYQCGFRRDRSTTDQIFNLRQILYLAYHFYHFVYHLFNYEYLKNYFKIQIFYFLLHFSHFVYQNCYPGDWHV